MLYPRCMWHSLRGALQLLHYFAFILDTCLQRGHLPLHDSVQCCKHRPCCQLKLASLFLRDCCEARPSSSWNCTFDFFSTCAEISMNYISSCWFQFSNLSPYFMMMMMMMMFAILIQVIHESTIFPTLMLLGNLARGPSRSFFQLLVNILDNKEVERQPCNTWQEVLSSL